MYGKFTPKMFDTKVVSQLACVEQLVALLF